MAYSVSKAAGKFYRLDKAPGVNEFGIGLHLMQCLASSQGPKVRVNAVCPGLLLTDWVNVSLLARF